jgi:1-acyl-sn-glycerol-3-phosphate acyltransferase
MAKKELFKVPVLRTLIRWLHVFPVDRTGVSISSMKHAVSVLKEDKVLGIFPEGTRVKGYDENNAKAGVSMIANMANSVIVPVFIRSKYKLFSKIEIVFGEPTNYFTSIEGRINSEMHMQIGKQILRDIYSLEDKLI